jgi:hypothetical protein
MKAPRAPFVIIVATATGALACAGTQTPPANPQADPTRVVANPPPTNPPSPPAQPACPPREQLIEGAACSVADQTCNIGPDCGAVIFSCRDHRWHRTQMSCNPPEP